MRPAMVVTRPEPLVIGMSSQFYVMLVLFAFFFGIPAFFIYFSEADGAIYFLAIWAAMTGLAFLVRAWLIKKQTGMIGLGQGFLWVQKGRKSPVQIPIADVNMRLEVRDLIKNKVVIGQNCKMYLRGAKRKILIADSGTHPFRGVLEDLFKAKLAYLDQNSDHQIKGKGWVTTSFGLQIGQKPPIAWSHIYPPIEYEDQIIFHSFDKQDPILNIHQGDFNANFLLHLAAEKASESRQMSGLGKKFLRIRLTTKMLFFIGLLPLVFFTFITYIAWQADNSSYRIIGIAGLAVSSALVFALTSRKFTVFNAGMVKTSILGKQEMLYAEATSLTLSRIKIFVNLIYTGTTTSATITSENQTIKVYIERYTEDSELDPVWDTLIEVIAEKMYVEMQRSNRVPWTKGLYITELGLEGVKKKGVPRFIPFHELNIRDDVGGIQVYYLNKTKLFFLPSSTPQFFPGLLLFQKLRSQSQQKTDSE